MTEEDSRHLTQLCPATISRYLVDSDLYVQYNVKRGMRDLSGKGVLAGLTTIGEVRSHTETEDGLGPGKLIYRGIDIETLVEGFWTERRTGFEETTYLLLFGELPDRKELDWFIRLLAQLRRLPHDFIHSSILTLASRDIMNAMAQTVQALYVIDENADGIDISNVLRQSLSLIAVFPLIAVYCYHAHAYRYADSPLLIRNPRPDLSAAANILYMLREDGTFTPMEERLLDLSLIIHAEHGGGNNSSFTTHVVTSSGTDTYSAITAALGSLKGPRHGGANIKSMQMVEDLKQNVTDWESETQIIDYLGKILDREAFDRSGLIYGVGHAVYSVSDPRTQVLRKHLQELAEEKGLANELRLYEKIERLAPDVIANKRKMYKGVCANVDLYSGLLYKVLGIPLELYTPLFAVSRIVGWCAHRIEELANDGKIIRPAYKSVSAARDYVPLDNRPPTVD